MKLKYGLHAFWVGWKTRKLISLIKFENLKRQAEEIEEFYQADLKTINSRDWYKNVKNNLNADQKKEKVRQMRERNQRMKEI
jgi:hypothetical protein